MIGVAAPAGEREVVREFFELFKTPWEFYQKGQKYDVLVCTLPDWKESGVARLTLFYHGAVTAFDEHNRIPFLPLGAPDVAFSYRNRRLPIYGRTAIFPARDFSVPREDKESESLAFLVAGRDEFVVRLGYDLFQEVRHLLVVGQPPKNAASPTLDLHIALLREMITRSGLPLVEIPPVPDGYNFIACLTHDIDHPLLRNHKFDHTMFGFLYRATAGSVLEVCRGRKTLGQLCQSVGAACKLPLVHLGLAKDPWTQFDRYLEIEAGLGSTYFVIPRKGYAGADRNGRAPAKRAAGYAISDIKPQLEKIRSQGGEIGLHGIDAWLDDRSGRNEQQEVEKEMGGTENGVRMHWLYFDENSPAILDKAGFSFDSTVGYNETVGFRSGTAQAYRPLGVNNLLELPLHIMDTALFYPSHLNLSNAEAEETVHAVFKDVSEFGGVITINWHDRSIASERLWDRFYKELLREIKRRSAWFPTAARAVRWFKDRRAATFGHVSWNTNSFQFSVSTADGTAAATEMPCLKARVHRPALGGFSEKTLADSRVGSIDLAIDAQASMRVTMAA